MNSLFKFVNSSLLTGLRLKTIKDNLPCHFSPDVIEYCKKKSIYSENKYNRIKLHEYSNEIFELILICWNSNSETRIHDHPEDGCVMHLISGNLEEHLYNCKGELQKITKLNIGESTYMENSIGYHKIRCVDKAMSLHIYSPINHKMLFLEEKKSTIFE
jgi:hypothetical protein